MTKNIYFVIYGDIHMLDTSTYEVKNLCNWEYHQRISNSLFLIKEDGLVTYKLNGELISEKIKEGDIISVVNNIPYIIKDKSFSTAISNMLYAQELKDKSAMICKDGECLHECNDCKCL